MCGFGLFFECLVIIIKLTLNIQCAKLEKEATHASPSDNKINFSRGMHCCPTRAFRALIKTQEARKLSVVDGLQLKNNDDQSEPKMNCNTAFR